MQDDQLLFEITKNVSFTNNTNISFHVKIFFSMLSVNTRNSTAGLGLSLSKVCY